MKMLTAELAIPFRVVTYAIEQENKKMETPYECVVTYQDNTTTITGPAQFVMFVIGYLAASGEDGLLHVESYTRKEQQ